jgi:hypothetical protein
MLRKVVGDSIAFQRMKEDDIDYLDNDTHFTNYTQCTQCERNVCKGGMMGCAIFIFPVKIWSWVCATRSCTMRVCPTELSAFSSHTVVHVGTHCTI